MREVFLSDLTATARALLAVPPHERGDACGQLLIKADWADKFVKRFGRPHRTWGNGTLMAAARTRNLPPEHAFSDTDYIQCLAMVLDSLQRHRAAKTCKLR